MVVVSLLGMMDWRAARVELWSVRGNQGNVWIRQRIAFRSTDRTLRVCRLSVTVIRPLPAFTRVAPTSGATKL